MKNNIVTLLLSVCLSMSMAYSDKLVDIKKSGVLKAGVRDNFEPFGFKSRTGKLIGLDINLLQFIAKDLGVKLELVPVTTRNFMTKLSSNDVDVVAAAITHTVKRDKIIDFSISYFFDGQSILGKKNSIATSYKNYEGRRVGAVKNLASGKVFKVIQPLAEMIYFNNHNQMIEALYSNRVDAVTSNAAFLYKKAQKSLGKFKMIGKPFTLEPYSIALNENESNLRDAINFSIQKFVKTGEYKQEYKKWFAKRLLKRNPTLWPN